MYKLITIRLRSVTIGMFEASPIGVLFIRTNIFTNIEYRIRSISTYSCLKRIPCWSGSFILPIRVKKPHPMVLCFSQNKIIEDIIRHLLKSFVGHHKTNHINFKTLKIIFLPHNSISVHI